MPAAGKRHPSQFLSDARQLLNTQRAGASTLEAREAQAIRRLVSEQDQALSRCCTLAGASMFTPGQRPVHQLALTLALFAAADVGGARRCRHLGQNPAVVTHTLVDLERGVMHCGCLAAPLVPGADNHCDLCGAPSRTFVEVMLTPLPGYTFFGNVCGSCERWIDGTTSRRNPPLAGSLHPDARDSTRTPADAHRRSEKSTRRRRRASRR